MSSLKFAVLAALLPAAILAQSTISPSASSSLCLQPVHGAMADGSTVVLGPCNGSTEQKFFLESGVVRVFSNMCLNAGAANGDALTIATCDNTSATQLWTYDSASRTFQAQSGICMDLSHGTLSVGALVGVWTCSPNAANEIWDVVAGSSATSTSADGTTTAVDSTTTSAADTTSSIDNTTSVADTTAVETTSSIETTTVLDTTTTITDTTVGPTSTESSSADPTTTTASSTHTGSYIKPKDHQNLCISAKENKDGAEVVLTDCSDSDQGQDWTINGTEYTVFGDKCLDVTEGRNENGNKLQIWSCISGGSNQIFSENKQNSHIHWFEFGKCLDATNGVFQSGTPVQIWQCSQSKNQNWVIA